LFDPDGQHFFLSIGSSCNACIETEARRAVVLRYRIDGSDETIYAHGLRNAVAMAIEPTTGGLWVANNERNNLPVPSLASKLPIEQIVHILQEGQDYGWPNCMSAYGGKLVPNLDVSPTANCDNIPRALVTDIAHSAPLGATFYTGTKFPAEYHGAFFVAYHGSILRDPPAGYKVVVVPVSNGLPKVSTPRNFLTGFLNDWESWGRPVDVKMGPDEALYISDDRSNAIYRVQGE